MVDDDAPAGGDDVAVPVHILAIGELGDESPGYLDQDHRCLVRAAGSASDWRISEKGPWPARAIRLVSRFRVLFSNQKKRLRKVVRVMSASPESPACRVSNGPPRELILKGAANTGSRPVDTCRGR
jgi:hypothetical protein